MAFNGGEWRSVVVDGVQWMAFSGGGWRSEVVGGVGWRSVVVDGVQWWWVAFSGAAALNGIELCSLGSSGTELCSAGKCDPQHQFWHQTAL